jgi:hypothetical protein
VSATRRTSARKDPVLHTTYYLLGSGITTVGDARIQYYVLRTTYSVAVPPRSRRRKDTILRATYYLLGSGTTTVVDASVERYCYSRVMKGSMR